ncbi:MAG: hypothetical protein H0V70_12270 [Ktedonobacteraceae bacterium]|nr:hypothetical protein [Ktedonobacteraceae bacterium]
MKLEQVKEIANAVLYEGYLLYPYRRSAIKNRQRWTFGVVYPQEYSEAQGGTEPWTMQTECLLTGQQDTLLDVRVRFLHLLVRTVTHPPKKDDDVRTLPNNGVRVPFTNPPGTNPNNDVRVPFTNPPGTNPNNGVRVPFTNPPDATNPWNLASQFADEPWEEGMEREVSALNLSLNDLVARPERVEINFPAGRMIEQGDAGEEIVREQRPLVGAAIITAEPVDEGIYRVHISIENRTTGIDDATQQDNPRAVHRPPTLHSFVSTHTILQAHQGAFISLLETPEPLKALVEGCQNLRTWPVLVGEEGERDTMLSSPIILYDYPQIAPESPGPLFDGGEIDEILTLRILTLTDEEKEEIRQGDERAREILERTEAITPEQIMKLHGVIRRDRVYEAHGEGEDV